MIRKVSKDRLAELEKRTGVRVKYAEKKAEKAAAPDKPQEVVVTLPENLLEPLLSALETTIRMHEQTQADISKALAQMSESFPFNVEVTSRDSDGNAKNFAFSKPLTH